MDMGITDVTAGGVKPIRVEMPQVSSPVPQHVPKTEAKTPPKASAPSPAPPVVTPGGAGAVTANVSVTPSVMAADAMQPKAQTGTAVRTGKDADSSVSGERVSRPRGTNRVNRMPAQDGQRISRQQEEKKEPAEQDSYYERVMAEKAMENAEERLRALKHNVRIGYNDDIERYTITITDADKEVVKEIPSEETQKMIEHLHTMRGMMFETEV